jgi:Holliday junction resolvasome RuvABC endonuclease subunit
MAYGVIVEACERAGVRVVEYPPQVIKKAVANSAKAQKPQMRAAVQAYFGVDRLRGKDDGIDGIAIALCHVLKEQKEQEEMRRA